MSALGFFQIIYYIQNFGYITYCIVYHGNVIKRGFSPAPDNIFFSPLRAFQPSMNRKRTGTPLALNSFSAAIALSSP